MTTRASFFHWREDGRPLSLQQHHDESSRLSVTGVAPHDVNIGGPLVERLPCLERDGRFAFQLHDDLAFEHVDERIGIVPMDQVLCARRIRHLNDATLLAGVVREIDREQFLHVCGFGRNGYEQQECRQVSAEVQVRCLHTLFLSASWSRRAIAESMTLDPQSECLRERRGPASAPAQTDNSKRETRCRRVMPNVVLLY